MEYKQVIYIIADILKAFDNENPINKTFKPGIRPFSEPQIVKIIAQRLSSMRIAAYTKRIPDLDIQHLWAIEFMIVHPFGDNGKEPENWSVNMLHPYPGNVSLISDAIKQLHLAGYPNKGLFVIGFEHKPARISLDPLLNSFDMIAEHALQIRLGERFEQKREGLVHPEHQVLRCIGWEITPMRQ